jgi:GDPmannose 4,6-dehydratase
MRRTSSASSRRPQPTEIYNLAAQSHVQVSFETPEYTANADALGTLRLLEGLFASSTSASVPNSIKRPRLNSTAAVAETPQRETTPFRPRSPVCGGEALCPTGSPPIIATRTDFHASNGICSNHEGPDAGETFVTRKITRAVAAIAKGKQTHSLSGNSTHARLGATPKTMPAACG